MPERSRRVRIVATLLGLIAALAVVITPAVMAARMADSSCDDLPAVWCAGAP